MRHCSALAAFALAVAPSCSSRRDLGLRPHGTGGAPALGGAGGLSGKGGAITKPNVAGYTGDPGKHVDTPGRSVFTVVHGVVDAGLTAWCFARERAGERELVGDPVPPGGLPYGASLTFEELPGIDSKEDGVVPYLITGDLALIDGLDCADAVARAEAEMRAWSPQAAVVGSSGAGGEAGEGGAAGEGGSAGRGDAGGSGGSAGRGDAGGSGGSAGSAGAAGGPDSFEPAALRVGQLPALSAGTLVKGLSVLEVADGCFGSPVFTHRLDRFACGFEYTPERGSLSAEVVVLAREPAFDKLAMQALHASRGTSRMGVRSMPPITVNDDPATLVDNFELGALRPREPDVARSAVQWGPNDPNWTVEGTRDGTPYVFEAWATIRERAAIDELEDGRGYTLIAIGPSIDIEGDGFWNKSAFALVDNDPKVTE